MKDKNYKKNMDTLNILTIKTSQLSKIKYAGELQSRFVLIYSFHRNELLFDIKLFSNNNKYYLREWPEISAIRVTFRYNVCMIGDILFEIFFLYIYRILYIGTYLFTYFVPNDSDSNSISKLRDYVF